MGAAAAGVAGAIFQRAIERRNLLMADTVAREFRVLPLGFALALVHLYGEKGDRRNERAALRYLAETNFEFLTAGSSTFSIGVMSHPDPDGPADLTQIQIGEVWENPVTRERATILELPYTNPAGRVVAELTALVGARVVGEHRHPAIVERFTVLDGELTVKRDGQTGILREGETAVIEPGVWHDWWNASDRDTRVRVEVTPGERFAHMIETLFGLARLGHTNAKGMPDPLQLALTAREFSDVFVLRRPPAAVQRVMFAALAPIAHWRGYRATYPQISRTVLAPRE